MGVRTADLESDRDDELSLEIDLYEELSAYTEQPIEAREADVQRIVLSPSRAGDETPEKAAAALVTADPATVSVAEELPEQDVLDCVGDVVESVAPGPATNVHDDQAWAQEPDADDLVDLDNELETERRVATPARTGGIVCAECGTVSGGADLLCIECGAFLGEFAGGEEPTPVVEAAPVGPLCADCGEEVTSEEVFCPSCGAVLGA